MLDLIELGTIPNDGHGDSLRVAGEKINAIITMINDNPPPAPPPPYEILHATVAGNNPTRAEITAAYDGVPMMDIKFEIMDFSNPTKMWSIVFSATTGDFYIEKMLDI